MLDVVKFVLSSKFAFHKKEVLFSFSHSIKTRFLLEVY